MSFLTRVSGSTHHSPWHLFDSPPPRPGALGAADVQRPYRDRARGARAPAEPRRLARCGQLLLLLFLLLFLLMVLLLLLLLLLMVLLLLLLWVLLLNRVELARCVRRQRDGM